MTRKQREQKSKEAVMHVLDMLIHESRFTSECGVSDVIKWLDPKADGCPDCIFKDNDTCGTCGE